MYGLDERSAEGGTDVSRVHNPTVLVPQGQSRALSSFYVSFGGGMRLVGEDYLMEELSHLGLTRRGFRKLCRKLGVPLIKGNKGACVDFFAFVTAFKTVTRPGNPDFALPGTKPRQGERTGRDEPIPVKDVVDELVGGRAMFGMSTSNVQKKEIESAAHRLARTRKRVRR